MDPTPILVTLPDGHAASSAARWLLGAMTAARPPDVDEIAARIHPRILGVAPAGQMREQFGMFAAEMAPVDVLDVRPVDESTLSFVLRSAPTQALVELRCAADEAGLIVDLSLARRPDADGLAVETSGASQIGRDVRDGLHGLFEATYSEPDHGYLDEALERLGAVAVARAKDELVGFAIGRTRVLDLPGLANQTVCLAGLCCVAEGWRRRGLMTWLEEQAFRHESRIAAGHRLLVAGRMAHAGSLGVWRSNPSLVPRAGRRPSAWQQAIGRAIAAEYGVADFDAATFVCLGPGRPVGYPRVELDPDDELAELFVPVDRARGDALLALTWTPDPPPRWLDP